MPRKTGSAKHDGERIKRPDLPRGEPIRAWSTLFGSNGAGAPSAAGGSRSATDPPGAGPVGAATDSIRRGVELGYRVLDDYVRQGASVASSFASPARAWTPSMDDLPKMTERMLQYTSDFTSLWFDAMRVMTGNAAGQARSEAKAGAPAPDRASAADARSRVVLDVRSGRPAEIIVTLDEALPPELVVEPLRAATGKQSIDGATIKPPAEAGGPLRVRVHVPSGLPQGRYSGAVLDAATRQPRGRLTVTLSK